MSTTTTPAGARTWNDGARLAMVDIVAEAALYNDDIDIAYEISAVHDRLVDEVFAGDEQHRETIVDLWRRFGAIGWIGRQRLGIADLEASIDVVIGKQRDYGPANIARFGNHGLVIRAYDKVARYANLSRSTGQAANEPLEDTLLDFMGYACVALMWNTPDPEVGRRFLLPLV